MKSQYIRYNHLKKALPVEKVNEVRTEIIRDYYFNNRLAAINPLFQKLITEEREALIDAIRRLDPEQVTNLQRVSPFSGINTLLGVKVEREAEIPLSETIGFLYEEETIYLKRTFWQKNCEKFIVEKYHNPDLFYHLGISNAVRDIEDKIPSLVGLSNNVLTEEQYSSEFELKMDLFLEQFQPNNSTISQRELIENALLVFFCINFLHNKRFEMKYYLTKLLEITNPENNLYWTYKFFEKELIIDRII